MPLPHELPEDDYRLGTHRYAVFAALLLINDCLEFVMSTSLAASATPSTKEAAAWTESDIVALVNFLHEQRATAEGSSFKPQVFQAAAAHLEGLRTKGAPKGVANTRSKWRNVRRHFPHLNYV